MHENESSGVPPLSFASLQLSSISEEQMRPLSHAEVVDELATLMAGSWLNY